MTDKEKYKNELLKKYLSKNIADEERHELEKLALDDSFLFEAMQGYSEIGGTHDIDVSDLRQKVLSVPTKKKSRSLLPYAIAASLALVIGMFFWNNDFSFGKEKTNIHAEAAPEINQPVEDQVAMNDDESMRDMRSKAKVGAKDAVFHAQNENDLEQENKANEISDLEVEQAEIQPVSSQAGNYTVDGVTVVESVEEVVEESNETRRTVEVVDAVADHVDSEDLIIEEDEIVLAESEIIIAETKKAESIQSSKDKTKESGSAQVGDEVALDKISSPAAGVMADQKKGENDQGIVAEAFDEYFNENLEKQFDNRELKSLRKDVALIFTLKDGSVSNFEVKPSQGAEVNGKLLSILKKGTHLFSEQNAARVVYEVKPN